MASACLSRICARCGLEVTPDALEGLCPRCVAPVAFAADIPCQSGRAVAEHEPLRYIGDYELVEEIARGGMGVVYSARQLSLNRMVAVKMILAGQLATPTEVRRFRAEAEAAATLQHPNIVAIHEIGEHHGQPYFSMDFIEGQSLAELSRDGPLPARRAAAIMQTVAEAIGHAHQRGILHRDLKPSNIVLDILGRPHITDFGLAKQVESELGLRASNLTLTGQVLGTPSFMSPEQVSGQRDAVRPTTDIYSLGAILYCLVTGRPPFQGESIQQVFAQVTTAQPLSPGLLNPALPRDLETICLKCLEKEPQKRYATASELADELKRFLHDKPIRARPLGPFAKACRWGRRNRTVSVSAALMLALVGGFSWHNWRTVTELRNTAPSFVALAESLVAAQKFPEALERIEVALRLQPRRPDYLVHKGNILLALLRLSEARDAYAEGLRLDGSLTAARERRAVCEALLLTRPTQSGWTTAQLTELYQTCLQHGLSAEAYAVSRHLDAADARFIEWLQSRLTAAGITNRLQRVWHRPSGLRARQAGLTNRAQPGASKYLALSLAESDIADLSPLRGLPLQELDLGVCRKVDDLAPLQGMQLVRLIFSFGDVEDLSPLSRMPLEHLYFNFNKVKDLGPLKAIHTLRSLNFHNVDVTDLGPLRELPLEELNFAAVRVTSLEPLQGMPLRSLTFQYVNVTDLSPLARLPLQALRMHFVDVSDLSPLRGLPLRVLSLRDCPLITDLAPLRNCVTLEQLVLPQNAKDIEFLRHMPNLQQLSYTDAFLSANEFWQSYDALHTPQP